MKTGLAAEGDHLVQSFGGMLVQGPVAATIDQVEGLSGVGQRDEQRMAAPGAVVGNVGALLALSVGADESAINIEDRFTEEGGGLLCPDPQSRLIDRVQQSDDIGFARRGGRSPLRWSGRAGAERLGRRDRPHRCVAVRCARSACRPLQD